MTYIWLKAGKADQLRNAKGMAELMEAAEFRAIPDEHQANRRQSGLVAEACEGSNQIRVALLFGQPPHGKNPRAYLPQVRVFAASIVQGYRQEREEMDEPAYRLGRGFRLGETPSRSSWVAKSGAGSQDPIGSTN